MKRQRRALLRSALAAALRASSNAPPCCRSAGTAAKPDATSKRSAQKKQSVLHVLESGAGRAMELRGAYSRSGGGMKRALPAQVEERCSTLLLAAEQERLKAKPQSAVEELSCVGRAVCNIPPPAITLQALRGGFKGDEPFSAFALLSAASGVQRKVCWRQSKRAVSDRACDTEGNEGAL